MKNVLLFFSTLLVFISFTACAPEIITPIQSELAISDIDTTILLDAFTFEKTTKIVVPYEEALPGAIYEIDTIITFDVETFEETMEIVKTRVISKTPQTAKIIDHQSMADLSANEEYQIDTIIMFNPDTYEETIQVVRTKIEGNNKKN